jgi:hypothetical protein
MPAQVKRRKSIPLAFLLLASSVVGCLFLGIIWVRAQVKSDCLWYSRGPGTVTVFTYRQAVMLSAGHLVVRSPFPEYHGVTHRVGVTSEDSNSSSVNLDPGITFGLRLGRFALYLHRASYPAGAFFDDGFCLFAPYSLLMVVGLVTAFACIRRTCRGSLASRREREALCLGCGYDLRWSKTRCPECGRIKGEN